MSFNVNIKVHTRYAIKKLLEGASKDIIISAPFSVISIISRPEDRLFDGSEFPKLEPFGFLGALTMCFKDYSTTEIKEGNVDYSFLFNKNQAKKIKLFIDKYEAKYMSTHYYSALLVHCDAGISRSGAVGLWACRYLGLDEDKFRKDNPRIQPNYYVYDILSKVSGLNKDYESVWKNT